MPYPILLFLLSILPFSIWAQEPAHLSEPYALFLGPPRTCQDSTCVRINFRPDHKTDAVVFVIQDGHIVAHKFLKRNETEPCQFNLPNGFYMLCAYYGVVWENEIIPPYNVLKYVHGGFKYEASLNFHREHYYYNTKVDFYKYNAFLSTPTYKIE